MGSGYKKLYESSERENKILTQMIETKDALIENLEKLVAVQQETLEKLNEQVDALQRICNSQQAVLDNLTATPVEE